MQISVATEYGIRGVIYLATRPPHEVVPLEEISRIQEAPKNYLIKIFQTLTRAKLLKSYKGARGGFALAIPPEQITFRQLVEILEGQITLNWCLVRPGECERDCWCLAHKIWKDAQERMMATLEGYTVADLAANLKEGLAMIRKAEPLAETHGG